MQPYEELYGEDDSVAIFVVHGIGKQIQGETAAQLYGNLESARTAIEKWQRRKGEVVAKPLAHLPYTKEGYWADYEKPEKTLADRWDSYTEDEKNFCRALWSGRVTSAGITYRWFLRQIVRLWAHPFRLAKTTKLGFLVAWPLYLLLTLCAVPLLTIIYVRKRSLMRDYLNDIRLYVDPRVKVEKDIVTAVDKSIRTGIMALIGLSPDFLILKPEELPSALGKKRRFDRVVWVAHSLGTVISYNVLAELIGEALEYSKNGDTARKEGAARFQSCLARFVTLGSPLDKIAFLFEDRLVPWPNIDRNAFFSENVDSVTVRFTRTEKDWWINFYHVLDPVSGTLEYDRLCHGKPPINLHTALLNIPGVAHTSYWKDLIPLRFILSRAYGPKRLPDKPLVQWPTTVLTLLAAGSYVLWAAVMVIALAVMAVWGWELVQTTWERATEIFANLGIPIS